MSEGRVVGSDLRVGYAEGSDVGNGVGVTDGKSDGEGDGSAEGSPEGRADGSDDGKADGSPDGRDEGKAEGSGLVALPTWESRRVKSTDKPFVRTSVRPTESVSW